MIKLWTKKNDPRPLVNKMISMENNLNTVKFSLNHIIGLYESDNKFYPELNKSLKIAQLKVISMQVEQSFSLLAQVKTEEEFSKVRIFIKNSLKYLEQIPSDQSDLIQRLIHVKADQDLFAS